MRGFLLPLAVSMLLSQSPTAAADVSASASPALRSQQAEARLASPAALTAMLEEAWNDHDMEAYGQLFHEDASFVNRFGGRYRGRQEIIVRHQEIHDSIYSDSTLVVDAPEVSAIADDIAILQFYMRLTAGAAHPAGPHQADALMLAVAIRKNGVWRFQAAQNVTLIGMDGPPMLRDR